MSEQNKQEPVAFDVVCDDCGGNGLDQHNQNYHCAACDGLGYTEKRLYTSPPANANAGKPWMGLTNNELQLLCDEYRILFGSWVTDFAYTIEAKLKEKNSDQQVSSSYLL